MSVRPTADLDVVAAALAAGGVVAVPTDTVYGLACDPGNAAAVDRIYALKQRPADLELGLLLAEAQEAEGLACLDAVARRLADAFWPGPLSLVVPVRPHLGLAVPRYTSSIMVRVPDHDLLRQLLRRTGPVASTSANPHGRPAAIRAAEVVAAFADQLDAVLDGGPAAGRPSTIIDCTQTPPRVLRAGPLTDEQLRPYLGG